MERKYVDLPQASGVLRATQLRMVEILLEIDRLCRKHNIRYWLDFGTLLGAVRHGGFIPWDDDMDICVHEDDFEKFQEICIKELPDWLMLQNEKTDPTSGMGSGLVKIRDKQSVFIHDFDDFSQPYEKGIFVDVFKFKTYPKMAGWFAKYLKRRISYAYGFFHYHRRVSFHNILCYLIYPISYILHKSIFNIMYVFGRSDRMFVTPERSEYGVATKKSDLFPLLEIMFEGHSFPAPAHPEARMRDLYGDYMKIPNLDQRRTHVKLVLLDKNEGVAKYQPG